MKKKEKLRRIFKRLNKHPDEMGFDAGIIQFYKSSNGKWMWKSFMFSNYVEGTRRIIKEDIIMEWKL